MNKKGKNNMHIEEAIHELLNCGDVGGYFLGCQIQAGLEETLNIMGKHGFSREESVNGIAIYCSQVAALFRNGEDVQLPFYREDEIDEYEAICLKNRLAPCA